METKSSLFEALKNASNEDNKLLIYNEFLRAKTIHNNQILNCQLELSPVCNLKCKFCYVRMTNQELAESGQKIMRFDDWKYYIDELSNLGVFNFSLSGGECMLHPDFIKIYNYIYDLGKQVSLITNCTCLTDEILKAFIQRPPTKIYITVYGASKETYSRLCGSGEAFERVLHNIDILLENHMPVMLQSTIGNDNKKDFTKLYDIAQSKGVQIVSGDTLTQFGKCDEDIIKESQVDITEFQKELKDFLQKNNSFAVHDDNKYMDYEFPTLPDEPKRNGMTCNSARNYCAINWQGLMKPCVSFDAFTIDPRTNGGFKESWDKLCAWGKQVPLITECQLCIFRNECRHCIAIHYNDTHEFGKVSPRLCFKIQHPEEAAKLQAEYDRRQALKKAEETKE